MDSRHSRTVLLDATLPKSMFITNIESSTRQMPTILIAPGGLTVQQNADHHSRHRLEGRDYGYFRCLQPHRQPAHVKDVGERRGYEAKRKKEPCKLPAHRRGDITPGEANRRHEHTAEDEPVKRHRQRVHALRGNLAEHGEQGAQKPRRARQPPPRKLRRPCQKSSRW